MASFRHRLNLAPLLGSSQRNTVAAFSIVRDNSSSFSGSASTSKQPREIIPKFQTLLLVGNRKLTGGREGGKKPNAPRVEERDSREVNGE